MTPDDWEFTVRPRRTPYYAYAAAFLIAGASVTVGLLLKVKASGVYFQTADQVAIALLGILIAGAVLLFARPRLRIGPRGVLVRNMLGDRLVEWPDVVDISFPRGARWARVDLPDDEYISAMAIQAVDRQHAVDAMDRARTLMMRYRTAPGQSTVTDIASSSAGANAAGDSANPSPS